MTADNLSSEYYLKNHTDIENKNPEILRLFVIRHGQTDCNKKKILQGHLNTSLNDEGVQQAKLCGDRFANIKVDGFASSDLNRCKQTLNEIIKHHNDGTSARDVYCSANFRERGFGPVEGMVISEAIEYATKQSGGLRSYRDFGEDRDEFRDRLYNAVDGLVTEVIMEETASGAPVSKNLVLVSHGGSIRTLLNHFANGLNLAINENLIDKDNAMKVVYNTSVTIFDFYKKDVQETGKIGHGIIQIIGDTAHLGKQYEVQDQRIR